MPILSAEITEPFLTPISCRMTAISTDIQYRTYFPELHQFRLQDNHRLPGRAHHTHVCWGLKPPARLCILHGHALSCPCKNTYAATPRAGARPRNAPGNAINRVPGKNPNLHAQNGRRMPKGIGGRGSAYWRMPIAMPTKYGRRMPKGIGGRGSAYWRMPIAMPTK